MYIEGAHGGYWNLHHVVNYRRHGRKGGFLLMFPIGGGNVKIDPDHPQFRQVEQFLLAATLGHDQPE